jgi:hypothetical protein
MKGGLPSWVLGVGLTIPLRTQYKLVTKRHRGHLKFLLLIR